MQPNRQTQLSTRGEVTDQSSTFCCKWHVADERPLIVLSDCNRHERQNQADQYQLHRTRKPEWAHYQCLLAETFAASQKRRNDVLTIGTNDRRIEFSPN
jgi:hypothetical protein